MTLSWKAIERLAKAHHCEDPFANESSLRRSLEFWYCRKFNKPLKDPLLAAYTLNELAYEYLRYVYLEPESDPRKELKEQEIRSADDEWVKQMLLVQKQKQEKAAPVASPEVVEPEPVSETPVLPDISTKFED